MFVFVFLLFFPSFFQFCSGTQTITDCVDNYYELKSSILNSSENAENLLKSFYPPNQSPAHVLNVYYYINDFEQFGNETHPKFENPNITADYIFQWVDSSTLLLTEFRLFRALSFGIAGLETGEVSIKVPLPFCNNDTELELLNLATVWLKTFTAHDRNTEYYYSMYFNNEKFVVLGNSIRSSTSALVICEYFASGGALLVIYTILMLCRYELFYPMSRVMSYVSVPCLVATITILIKDIYSYTESFRYVSVEWNLAFPMPYVFPIFAIVNCVMSIIMTIFIGPKFPVPALLKLCCMNIGLKGRFYNSVIQTVLVFSITSCTVLITFHFAWVVLAFSAYPVRSLASQAFTIPFLVISFAIYFAINYMVSFPTAMFLIKERSKRIAITLVSAFLTVPFLIALMGVLYYYSRVLIDVNDSQNYPIKTVIGGLLPTVVTAFAAWAFRNTIKAYTAVLDDKEKRNSKEKINEEQQSSSNGESTLLEDMTELSKRELTKEKKENVEDEELLSLVEDQQ